MIYEFTPWVNGFTQILLGAAAGLTLLTLVGIVIAVLKYREERKKNTSMIAVLKTCEAILDTVEEIRDEIKRRKKK